MQGFNRHMTNFRSEDYDQKVARKNQLQFTQEHNDPHFAPSNGLCFKCHRGIYMPIAHGETFDYPINLLKIPVDSPEVRYITGITIKEAATQLITGCPHCGQSYCE